MLNSVKAMQLGLHTHIFGMPRARGFVSKFFVGVRSKATITWHRKERQFDFAPSRSRKLAPSRAAYEPYPMNWDEFHRVALSVVQSTETTRGRAGAPGFLLFTRHGGNSIWLNEAADGLSEEIQEGMLVAIGGDTYQSICMLLQGQQPARPLTVDLLWQILERGRGLSKREWTIRSVAITGMSEATFLGRIFFGYSSQDDPDTEIAWDVDCRPSDACWLALKCGAPIYVHQSVWDSNAAPLGEHYWQLGLVTEQGVGNIGSDEDIGTFLGEHSSKLDVASLTTTVQRNDPEPVKLLKMELKVALKEEDYVTAAMIRDSSVMKMHVAALTAKKEGDLEAVARYERRLQREIEKWMR